MRKHGFHSVGFSFCRYLSTLDIDRLNNEGNLSRVSLIYTTDIAAEQIAALIADKPLSYEDEFYDEREEIRWQYRSAAWSEEFYYAYGIH